MKNFITLAVVIFLVPLISQGQNIPGARRPGAAGIRTVAFDSLSMSDPYILADPATHLYYLTSTGGSVWKSPDLRTWQGPYNVTTVDTTSWMGTRPGIWAPEIHIYNNKYYYFGTFTNGRKIIDSIPQRSVIPRRAVHILVSDKPDGPYKPISKKDYVPENWATLDASFWIENGKPYLVYCHEWLQIIDGTVEAVPLNADLSAPNGNAITLFRASSSPWAKEMNTIGEITNGSHIPGWVTDGPYLFRTKTGKLGVIWSSWGTSRYALGVAYSTSGNLRGPWVHEAEPLISNNSGHGMFFKTFEGKLLLCLHYQDNGKGRNPRKPMLLEVDDSGDKLKIGKRYEP
jgi:beta-xylosidase